MARPFARLPAPEPTPAPVDPLAAERWQSARATSGKYARALLSLADTLPVPADAAEALATLRRVEPDLDRPIGDDVLELLDVWPELSEAIMPHLSSLHRMSEGSGEVAHV